MEFHFRNFDEGDMWFGVYHEGCGDAPWKDGRPKCWHTKMDRNTDGRNSSHDVYSPADWVLHFETYMNYILDGIKLVVDTAAFIASEGEDAEAAVDAVKDAFALGKDAAEAKAKHDAENANYDKLTHLTSRGQLDKVAGALGVSASKVREIARNMGLGSTGWVLLASDAYQQIMRDDNELNNNMGWSIYNNGDADSDFKANHVFIKNGKFYFYGVSDSEVNYDHYSVNEIAKRILTSFWNNAKNRRSGIGYDTDGLQADLRYYWQKEMPSNTKLRLDYENDPAAYALTGITSQDYQKTWSGVYNLVKDTLFVRSTKGVAIRVRQLVLENVPNRKAAFNGINNGHDLEGLAQDIRYYLGECLPPGSGHSYNNNWVSSAALAAARMDQDDLWQNIYNLVDHNMGTKFWI